MFLWSLTHRADDEAFPLCVVRFIHVGVKNICWWRAVVFYMRWALKSLVACALSFHTLIISQLASRRVASALKPRAKSHRVVLGRSCHRFHLFTVHTVMGQVSTFAVQLLLLSHSSDVRITVCTNSMAIQYPPTAACGPRKRTAQRYPLIRWSGLICIHYSD